MQLKEIAVAAAIIILLAGSVALMLFSIDSKVRDSVTQVMADMTGAGTPEQEAIPTTTTTTTTLAVKTKVNWHDAGFSSLDAEVADNTVPDVKLWQWDRSEFLQVKMQSAGSSVQTVDKGKLVQSFPSYDVAMYNTTIDGTAGFEIETTLKSVPASNTFVYDLNYSDVVFYYQPPLYQENGLSAPNATCNATDCAGSHRPENVVGSYAVYSTGKKNNEYTTGKLFHIYRPQVCDADKSCTWADLNIGGKTLTVTVDTAWLDKAKYPVVIDPTFGYDTKGLSADNPGIGTSATFSIYGSNFAGVDGTATMISVYTYCSGTGCVTGTPQQFRGGLYDNSTNQTVTGGTASSDTVTTPNTLTWYNSTINAAVLSSKNYIITAFYSNKRGAQSASMWLYYDAGYTGQGITNTTTAKLSYPTFPSPLVSVSNDKKYSIFVTYTAGGGSTCTYGGSGDWTVSCAEGCTIASDTNIGTNALIFSGAGSIYMNANLAAGSIVPADGCKIIVADGKHIALKYP